MATVAAPNPNLVAAKPQVALPPQPKTNLVPLYVGDLHPEVQENQLWEIFNTIGSVISLRICRDTNTRASLGYGYVNFLNQEDAEKALETLNFEPVRGKPIRIMWSQRDPSLRRSGVGNIFVNHLDKTISTKDIYDTFCAFGDILSCKVATDENGESKGFCFIHFSTQEAADHAINALNGKKFNGTKVSVCPFISKADRDKYKENRPKVFNNCYVKPLDHSIDDKELENIFNEFGDIISAKVMKDENGNSKGFGFVSFQRPEDASKAVEKMHNAKQENGETWYVQRAQKKSERDSEKRRRLEEWKKEKNIKGTNLFIRNIEIGVEESQLVEEFSKYGTVKSCKIMRLDNGVSRGFGFINFEDPEEADYARTKMNGVTLSNTKKPLYVAQAQRKEERKEFLTAKFAKLNHEFANFPNNPFMQNVPNIPNMPHMTSIQFFNQLAVFAAAMQQQRMMQPQAYQVQPNMRPQMMQNMPRHQIYSKQPPLPPRNQRNQIQQQHMNGHPPHLQQQQPQHQQPPQILQNQQQQQQHQQQNQQQQQQQQQQQRKPYGDNVGGARGDEVAAEPKNYASVAASNVIGPGPTPQPAVMRRQAPAEANRAADANKTTVMNISQLVDEDPAKAKEIIGEQLYPKVDAITGSEQNRASKVTGMLLESMEVQDLLLFLEDQGSDVLRSKVKEGIAMLEKSPTMQ